MGKDIASWTLADETALIAYLREHKAAAGDGGSFKATTFEGAAAVVEEKRTKGGPKTGNACQNKWIVLRRTFRAIQAIQNQSGWTWSDEKGADISPDMEPAWEKFVLAHKDAKPFKIAAGLTSPQWLKLCLEVDRHLGSISSAQPRESQA